MMKTHAEFLAEMHEKHPNIKVVGVYSGCSNKVEWICSNCGESQFALPGNLLKPSASGLCRKCFNLQLATNRQKGHEQFLQQLKKINPDIKITGTYIGKNHKIEWECNECGEKIYSLPGNLLRSAKKPYCRKCGIKKNKSFIAKEENCKNDKLTLIQINTEKFYEKLGKLKYPPILLSDYRGYKEKIQCKCSVCGYEWESKPPRILNNKHPCPKCADRSHTLSNTEFLQRLGAINPYIIPLESYVSRKQNIKCRCSRCGYEWSVSPGGLLSGNGCPSCSHTATSFFEQFLLLAFRDVLGDDRVLSRDKSAIGAELDIYIPDMNIAFEYGAWYYHKNRLKVDLKKVERCNQSGIRLIRIYDSCGDDDITGENVVSYSQNIALDINCCIDAVKYLFSIAKIDCVIDDAKFLIISDKAYDLSRKLTTDQFKEKISILHPNVEVLGEYKSNTSNIACKCNTCGLNWNPTAHSLISGHGCPNCFRLSQTKDEKKYLEEVYRVNPNIEVLEPYIASNRRILARCKKCGFQWKPYASTLLHGYGCIHCKKEDAAQKAISDIIKANPDLKVLGKYEGNNKPIEVKCINCGNVWSPRVFNLIRNTSHCPVCSRTNRNKNLSMTEETFLGRLAEISPDIEVVGNFVGNKFRVDVQCKICGYQWSPIARNLLTGRGCRNCKYKSLAEKSRRTPEQFVMEMKDINPNILILGKYTKANARIDVECLNCGRKWSPMASSLISGTGCPSCSKKRKK